MIYVYANGFKKKQLEDIVVRLYSGKGNLISTEGFKSSNFVVSFDVPQGDFTIDIYGSLGWEGKRILSKKHLIKSTEFDLGLGDVALVCRTISSRLKSTMFFICIGLLMLFIAGMNKEIIYKSVWVAIFVSSSLFTWNRYFGRFIEVIELGTSKDIL